MNDFNELGAYAMGVPCTVARDLLRAMVADTGNTSGTVCASGTPLAELDTLLDRGKVAYVYSSVALWLFSVALW